MRALSALLVLAVLSSLATAAAPETIRGKVFLDANRNGKLDAGEKGMPGIRVTDGLDFVTTAEDGSYAIQPAADPMFKYRPAQTVSVCWPSGTWPTGKHWVRLKDIPDAAAVPFGLREDRQSLPFMYLQHSDSHCRLPGGCEAFAKFVNGLGAEVKFVLDTGDTSFGPEDKDGPTTFRVLTDAEKQFQPPFLHAIGNHDVMPEGDAELAGFGAWTRDMGPMRWSFDYSDVHFAGVDCFEEEIRPGVVQWLQKDFQAQPKGRRIVLCYHYPNPDGDTFHKLLKDYNVQLIHAGHNHTSRFWDRWHAPMVTVFDYKPLGNCNAMVVTPQGVEQAYYCLGCKGKSFVHSRRCPMGWETGLLLHNVQKLFGKAVKIENQALATATEPIAISTTKVLIQTQIEPGSAKRVGLRVGSQPAPMEIAFTGDHLVIAGAPLRFDIGQPDKLLRLTVFVQKGMVAVWADGCFYMEKPIQPVTGPVSAFAEGGMATIKTMTVTEIKPDPADKSAGYHNNDIGGLRRMPD